MLKGINPLLGADVLHALRSMGHGDEIVVVDQNFPSDSVARQTSYGKLLTMDSRRLADAVAAILSLCPLDDFVDDAAVRMEIVGNPSEIPNVQAEVQAVIDAAEGKPWPLVGIERFAFYDRAARAYAVVKTGEFRFYGCVILKKGVIGPAAV